MTKPNKNFLEQVTFKKELALNKLSHGRCLLGVLLTANTIVLMMSSSTLTTSSLTQFIITMLVYSNGCLAAYIAYKEVLKLEQRKYVAESISRIMSRA